MDEKEATRFMLDFVDKLAAAGEILWIADAYAKAQDPEIKAKMEEALNDSIPRRRIVHHHWDGATHDPIVSLVEMDGLPESTYITAAGVLDFKTMGSIFALRQKSGSEKVRDACDDALIKIVMAFETGTVAGHGGTVFELAQLWKGKDIPARVSKARDAALVRTIEKWGKEAKREYMLKLSCVEGISPAVKDAAAAALSGLDNIPDKDFSKALDVLAACGELDALMDVLTEAGLSRTKGQIQNAMDKAMDVAVHLLWADDMSYPGHQCLCSLMKWHNSQPFERLLEADCPDSLKQKARRILEEHKGGVRPPEDPLGLEAKSSENRNMADSCLRMVKLYLLQERHRNRDVLSGGTVEPPARGTSSPVGRTRPHARLRC